MSSWIVTVERRLTALHAIRKQRAYSMASIPFLSASARSLRDGPLGRTSPRPHLLTIYRAHVQSQSERRLAHTRLFANTFDRFGSQRLRRSEAPEIEVTHGGFVDRADAMKVLHRLVKRPERQAMVALRLGHISNSLHPFVACNARSALSDIFSSTRAA
jgi:hypothetical protein